MSTDQVKKKKRPMIHIYISEEHDHEIKDFVNDQAFNGRKNPKGRKWSRNDFILEAIEAYSKKNGLKTSPYDD